MCVCVFVREQEGKPEIQLFLPPATESNKESENKHRYKHWISGSYRFSLWLYCHYGITVLKKKCNL